MPRLITRMAMVAISFAALLFVAARESSPLILSAHAKAEKDICSPPDQKAGFVAVRICGWDGRTGPATKLNWGKSWADAVFQSRGDLRRELYREGVLDAGCSVLGVGLRNLKGGQTTFLTIVQDRTLAVKERIQDGAANIHVVVDKGVGDFWIPVSALTSQSFLQLWVSEESCPGKVRPAVRIANNNPDGGGFTNPNDYESDRFVGSSGERLVSWTRLNLAFLP